ncbi:MAG: hypothetical protein WC813_02695 [Patescibacteria group bacterium]|jgi:hypothetical protein
MSEGGNNFLGSAAKQKMLQALFGIVALVFGLLYVFQMNEASMKAYTIRDLENQRQSLAHDSDRLLTEIDRLRSLASISDRQAFLGLVEPVEVKYMKISSNEVALGR